MKKTKKHTDMTYNTRFAAGIHGLSDKTQNKVMTGFVSLVTFLDPDLSTGTYFIYDAKEMVNLIGFLELLLSDLKNKVWNSVEIEKTPQKVNDFVFDNDSKSFKIQ